MRVKVNENTQIHHEGELHEGGAEFDAPTEEAEKWVAAGYATEVETKRRARRATRGGDMAVVVADGQFARIDPAYNQTFSADALSLYGGLLQDYDTLYKTQPNLRLVVNFLGRNVAQLGLKVYRRLSDTDRKHLPNHP